MKSLLSNNHRGVLSDNLYVVFCNFDRLDPEVLGGKNGDELGKMDYLNKQFWSNARVEDLQKAPSSAAISLLNVGYTKAVTKIATGLHEGMPGVPNTPGSTSVIQFNEGELKLWQSRRSSNKAYMLSDMAITPVFQKQDDLR